MERTTMIVAGIDPGSASIGYAILDCAPSTPELKDAGVFSLPAAGPERLRTLYKSLSLFFSRWRPERIGVEKLFFDKNRKTAMAVAEARGIILLTAALQKITLSEYTPLEVKKAVTGYGTADKAAIEKMIRLTVRGAEEFRARDDTFDAIAIALTAHLRRPRIPPSPPGDQRPQRSNSPRGKRATI